MPTYRKRPRRNVPPPLAGGGAADASPLRGRGRARELRANMTDAEQKLWSVLRRKNLNGLRFRRQFSLGPYFADFICLPARLIIEVDGGQHAEEEQMAHDQRRTAWLNSQNFRVLRFWNLDVLENLEGVVDAIDGALRQPLPRDAARRAPSREGRGE